jgi:ribose-phosphate pyrophosphokinase
VSVSVQGLPSSAREAAALATRLGAIAIDAVVTLALFPEAAHRAMISAGVHSVRSTRSVPHFTNAIALDELFNDALQGELTEPSP